MEFAQTTIPLSHATLTQAGLLRPGRWLVEAGSAPPPEHRPALLLGATAAEAGIAVTLRTASVLQLDIGSALIAWLGGQGCKLVAAADVALHEVLLNAAIHGNLEVASGPSHTWQDLEERAGRVAEALRDPVRAERVITAVIAWNLSLAIVAVADQGGGFAAVETPARPATGQRRAAGRGLDIARAVARVEVCNQGRCTRLTFTRSGPPETR